MGLALAKSISSASSTEMTYLMYVIFILYYIIYVYPNFTSTSESGLQGMLNYFLNLITHLHHNSMINGDKIIQIYV